MAIVPMSRPFIFVDSILVARPLLLAKGKLQVVLDLTNRDDEAIQGGRFVGDCKTAWYGYPSMMSNTCAGEFHGVF